jgi:hypothetical protein
MRKRFAIVIGVAAAGVMALGAQTATAAAVKYETTLKITHEGHHTDRGVLWHGSVRSEAGKKCSLGRQVILFRKRPVPNRKLGATLSALNNGRVGWGLVAPTAGRVYAKVTRRVGDGFVCRADRSRFVGDGFPIDERWLVASQALGPQTAAAVVEYDTKLTITTDRGFLYHGEVRSEGGRKCVRGRWVVLFKQRPGADLELGKDRTGGGFTGDHPGYVHGWGFIEAPRGVRGDVYAKVRPKVRDRFVCRADRAPNTGTYHMDDG